MDDFSSIENVQKSGDLSLDPVKNSEVPQPIDPPETLPKPGDTSLQFAEDGQDSSIQTKEKEPEGPVGSENGTIEGKFTKTDGDGIPIGPMIYVNKLIDQADRDLIAFVSDLHMGRELDDFDKADQTAFVNMLTWLKSLGKKIQLVLLGDIIEIWESVNPNEFTAAIARKNEYAQNYNGGLDITTRQTELIHIITEVLTTHKVVADALAQFIEAGNSIIYVFGNHDDEISQCVIYQRVIKSFIPGIEFRPGFLDSDNFELYAEHGHRFDPPNLADDPENSYAEGRPFGRVLVEEFLVKVEALEVNGEKPFRNLDAFSPLGKYLDYYECVVKDLDPAERQKLDATLTKYVNKFVELVDASGLPKGPSRFDNLINFLSVLAVQLVNIEIPKEKLGTGAGGQQASPISTEEANQLMHEKGDVKCVVMGHTHEGFIKDRIDGLNGMYINTGTWMDKVHFDSLRPCQPEALPSRHVTLLIRTLLIPGEKLNGFGVTETSAGGQIEDDTPQLAFGIVNAFLFSYKDGQSPIQLANGSYRVGKAVLLPKVSPK